MDRGGDPTLPPPAKSPKLSDTTTIAGGDPTLLPPAEFPKLSDTTAIESDTTTINSLGEDLLLAIFLHLPSLATLTRAAFTCRAWRRAVASSPAFRRRFRELHRAPLLGLVAEPHRDALPCFAPAPRRDRDVLAAIRGGDFSLTTLLDPDDWAGDAPLSWRIHDCKDGYLVLLNWDTGLLATVNPLTLQFTEYIEMPFNRNTGSSKPGCPISLDVHLIFSDEEPMSFRLVWLFHKDSEVQVAVFTSETGDWFFHPWVDIVERTPPHFVGENWLHFGLQSNGKLYWPFTNLKHMLKLDTETMEFSVWKLPPHLEQSNSYVVGETMNGTLWIVYCSGWSIDVLRYGVDDGGEERWIFVGMIEYDEGANPLANNDTLHVVTMKDGFVYLATSEMILSLCLETMELEKLFPRSFRAHHFQPYIMAWPPSLVGNYGSFAAMQDGPNAP